MKKSNQKTFFITVSFEIECVANNKSGADSRFDKVRNNHKLKADIEKYLINKMKKYNIQPMNLTFDRATHCDD